MKKSKFTKVISFLLAIVLVISTAFVVIAASPYSTVSTTYGCPKALCFKKLTISGPYGDPTEKIDSAVPYLGGNTYENVYNNHFGQADKMNKYHLYIVYCPNYDYSDSSLFRHTMTLMFCGHGYTTKSYTQFNSTYHYANKVCDHATDIRGSKVYGLTQHLCGENAYMEDTTMEDIAEDYQSQIGCGKESSILEAHTISWQRHAAATDEYHELQNMCICGAVISATQEAHTFETAKYYDYSATQHHISKFCTVCQDTIHIYENHKFTYGAWTNSSSTQHKRTATCSDCGYTKTEYADHKLSTSDPIRYGTEDENYDTYSGSEYHRYDITCSDCDYESSKYEPHEMYVEKPWFDSDATYHNRITRCAKCSYGVSTYRYHNYPKELYTYVSLNATIHSITKHCDTCTRTVDGGTATHNYVAGEWYKYGTENPYDDEYDHMKYHQRESVCSDCGNIKIEHAEHDWYWVTESWNYSSEERHTRTKRCKDCDYGWGYTDYHHFTTDPYYEQYSEDEHTKINPCDECEYEKETLEAHSFTASTVYTQFSESQHQVTQSCICGEKHISYADHVDQNSDCYCDKCGYLMTKFSVTVPTTMVLAMGTDGEVYAPSDVVIINNSTAAVSVKKADINSRNGWNIVPYSTNMANEKVDAKKIGFKMNGIQTDSAGTTDSLSYNNSWIIEKDTSSSVVYDAVVSATSTPIDEQVIEIVYIVDWKE